MLKMNRTTEYGLIALRHMNRKGLSSHAVTSAREISDTYGFPFEITAKTLQRLKDVGLIGSEQGARGGYALKRTLQDVTLEEFLNLMEGPQAVVACTGESLVPREQPGLSRAGCEYGGKCEIKQVMNTLNDRFKTFLGGIRLAEIAGGNQETLVPLSRMSGEEP